MQLILAIEPDRRQAAQITAMVRAHLTAELVIAGSTSKALKALGERVPDLILTPALLPPADDALLADRLRELGPAAGHIQAVTIPILSEEGGVDQDRGMLSVLRRDRPRTAEDGGCEPSVFVNQVATYLQRAAQERQARATFGTPSGEAADDQPPAAAATSPAAAPAPELSEWIDIDQVMAAITDPGTTLDQHVRAGNPDRHSTPPAPTPATSAPAMVRPAPGPTEAPAPVYEYASASRAQLADDGGADEAWAFFDPAQRNFPALLTKLNAIANAEHAMR